jgi:hypothetical protein
MPQKVFDFMATTVALWDGLVAATAATPILPFVDDVRKASILIIAGVALVFSAGVGFSSWLGIPSTVRVLDQRMERVELDLCALRVNLEGGNPISCLVERATR